MTLDKRARQYSNPANVIRTWTRNPTIESLGENNQPHRRVKVIVLSAFDDFEVFLANLTIDMKNLTSNLRQLEKELIQIHERIDGRVVKRIKS